MISPAVVTPLGKKIGMMLPDWTRVPPMVGAPWQVPADPQSTEDPQPGKNLSGHKEMIVTLLPIV